MTEIPTLTTKRLILRAQTPRDTSALTAAFADDGFSRFITRDRRGLDAEEAWRPIALVAGSWAANGFGQWMVEERASGLPVGRIGPWQPMGWPDLEIAWAIFPEHQRKGFAVEGAAAAVDWAHKALRRNHFIHLIDPDNGASERVARALGGEPTGHWSVPTGEVVPIWTTRWARFVETEAYRRHVAAAH